MDTDYFLIRRMKRGEESAFDLFVQKYYKEILTYCVYHCTDKGYAEDITQETFMRFFAKLSVYHFRGKTKNYLYTIAGNLCKDYLRKIKETSLEEVIGREAENAEDHAEDSVNRYVIEWAIKQLPDNLKEVIILYYFQELKMIEIANILQISLPLVKYRLKQAKVKLEDLLREE